MLSKWKAQEKAENQTELKQQLENCKIRLTEQQLLIKEYKLPVIVLMEGWGTAGKGGRIGKLIEELDPRFFNVVSVSAPTEEEKRKPFLWRHFVNTPECGKFLFLDSGWMDETVKQQLHQAMTSLEYAARLESINTFERQLADNGTLLVKFFLQIGKKEQEKRISHLLEDKDTSWRVSPGDRWQNKHYQDCLSAFDAYLTATNTSYSPWHVVDSTHKKESELELYQILINSIDKAIEEKIAGASRPFEPKTFPLIPMPTLKDVDLSQVISDSDYKKELKAAQKKLKMLHNALYRQKIPVVIAYEGWDAAGKGGNIKRMTSALDPRGFEVIPIASPEPHEKARHYLWRFWNKLPKTGHIVIFDRTWYGRVMVERVEGFCTELDWNRAYTEINEFEKELTDYGTVVLKFWIHIDKNTQLERFRSRQQTPEKQWKITDEDWRNREKWEEYEAAINEMLQKTSTQAAPWHIIPSVDKKFARLETLRLVIDALETALRRDSN